MSARGSIPPSSSTFRCAVCDHLQSDHTEDSFCYCCNREAITWAQWPPDRARPTPEEWEAATARYRAEMNRAYERGYMGDAGGGLAFMMATYGRGCWWDFFVPDERIPIDLPDGLRLQCRPSLYDGDEPNGGNSAGNAAQGKP